MRCNKYPKESSTGSSSRSENKYGTNIIKRIIMKKIILLAALVTTGADAATLNTECRDVSGGYAASTFNANGVHDAMTRDDRAAARTTFSSTADGVTMTRKISGKRAVTTQGLRLNSTRSAHFISGYGKNRTRYLVTIDVKSSVSSMVEIRGLAPYEDYYQVAMACRTQKVDNGEEHD